MAAVACQSNRADSLVQTLPETVGGQAVTFEVITPQSPLAGVPADDVLAAVGKRREDAVIVVGGWPGGSVTAISLPAVSIGVLVETAIRTWRAATVESRSIASIAGQDVEVLAFRDEWPAYIWAAGSAIYIVETDDESGVTAVFKTVAGKR